jgi:cytoskeletal protein RodZ
MIRWITKKDKHEPTPSIEQQRSQILAEMGAQLWTLRLEQGFSLEEMVIMTKISQRLLQAIEQGNLDELPEPVYVQGLIRQFADTLGLNGTEFASAFPVGMNRVTLTPNWKTRRSGQLRPVHLYILYIFLIFCSVSGLSQLLDTATLQASNSQNSQKAKKETVTQSQPIQKTLGKAVVNQTFTTTNQSQEVEISVIMKEKSWLRVVADGKLQYEGELPQGTRRIWKAQEQLTVRAGNAGGVMVSVNQQQARQMGEPGKVEEVTIAAHTTP